MTNQKVLNLYVALQQINVKGAKFNYCIARNMGKIKPIIEAVKKADEHSEDYRKYDTARIELAKQHADKDDKGEPKESGGHFIIINQLNFDKELEKLREKHKKAIEDREKQEKEIKELLEQEAEIEFHKLKESDIPEDLTTKQLTSIIDIIE